MRWDDERRARTTAKEGADSLMRAVPMRMPRSQTRDLGTRMVGESQYDPLIGFRCVPS